jgi:hypothetical protein
MQRYLVGEWLFVGQDDKVFNCDNHVSFVNVMGRSFHKDYHVIEVHHGVTNGLGYGQLMVSHATQTTHGFIYQQRTKVFTNIVSLCDMVVPMLHFFEEDCVRSSQLQLPTQLISMLNNSHIQ